MANGWNDAELTPQARPLEELWFWLMDGTLQVAGTYETNEHHVLELRQRVPSGPLPAHLRTLLERALTATSTQRIAIEDRTSTATVAAGLKEGLAHVGAKRHPSRTSALLVLAARKAVGLETLQEHCEVQRVGERLVATVPRVDQPLRGTLPPAQLSLIRSLVDGSSYSEISKQQGVSMRTVANRTASTFHRLGVSGRNALVNRLCEREALSEQRMDKEP